MVEYGDPYSHVCCVLHFFSKLTQISQKIRFFLSTATLKGKHVLSENHTFCIATLPALHLQQTPDFVFYRKPSVETSLIFYSCRCKALCNISCAYHLDLLNSAIVSAKRNCMQCLLSCKPSQVYPHPHSDRKWQTDIQVLATPDAYAT